MPKLSLHGRIYGALAEVALLPVAGLGRCSQFELGDLGGGDYLFRSIIRRFLLSLMACSGINRASFYPGPGLKVRIGG